MIEQKKYWYRLIELNGGSRQARLTKKTMDNTVKTVAIDSVIEFDECLSHVASGCVRNNWLFLTRTATCVRWDVVGQLSMRRTGILSLFCVCTGRLLTLRFRLCRIFWFARPSWCANRSVSDPGSNPMSDGMLLANFLCGGPAY